MGFARSPRPARSRAPAHARPWNQPSKNGVGVRALATASSSARACSRPLTSAPRRPDRGGRRLRQERAGRASCGAGSGPPRPTAMLERDTDEPEQLVGALRRGLRRAGLSDIAAALAGASAGEVADGPRARRRAAAARRRGGPARERRGGRGCSPGSPAARPTATACVLVGRRLDPRLAALRGPLGAVQPRARAELAFDDAELARAARGRARRASPDAAQVARGPPADAGLAGRLGARGGRLARARPRRRVRGRARQPLGGAARRAARRARRRGARRVAAARPPAAALRAPSPTACAGAGALELLADAGPAAARGPPGLARAARPDPRRARASEAARRPRRAPSRGGRLRRRRRARRPALALLTGVDDHEGVAELLAARRWQELGALELAELRAILTTLPDEALAGQPARSCRSRGWPSRTATSSYRGELLERGRSELADRARRERREVEAELVGHARDRRARRRGRARRAAILAAAAAARDRGARPGADRRSAASRPGAATRRRCCGPSGGWPRRRRSAGSRARSSGRRGR